MKKNTLLVIVLMVLIALLAACGGESTTVEVPVTVEVTRIVTEAAGDAPTPAPAPVTFAEAGNTLQAVIERDKVICGGNAAVPGFGFLNEDGSFAGFDIDFCKVVAAAALGDATKFEIRATSGTDRFPILQSGEIDVLIRNTTWTISRDSSLGFDFGPTTFYDGQGMMVLKASGIESLADMGGATVCVQAGTTTEKNLTDVFAAMGLDFEPKVYPDADTTRTAYDSGECDGFTTDKSGLVSQQTLMTNPADHIILADTMSKEPLGPLFRHGDNNWGDVISWATYCTIAAEEYGITSENVDGFLGGDDPVIQNLLGEAGDLGTALGLSTDFCYQVIKQVGNYAEIYARNLGPDTPFNLPRGLNSLYSEGGLLYAPPFR